jgi:hypothetical protein
MIACLAINVPSQHLKPQKSKNSAHSTEKVNFLKICPNIQEMMQSVKFHHQRLFSHKSHISASETSKFEKCGSFHSKS